MYMSIKKIPPEMGNEDTFMGTVPAYKGIGNLVGSHGKEWNS